MAAGANAKESKNLFRGFVVLAGHGLCLVLSGCGETSIQQPTYSVSGEVKLDGKPLKGATVVMHAVDETNFKWKELPQGTTDELGKFSLFTYSANDGAPAGDYKVGVAMLQESSDDGGDQVRREKGKARVPLKYADPRTSGLTAKVDAKATTLPAFELSSK